jgi:mannosyltransferase
VLPAEWTRDEAKATAWQVGAIVGVTAIGLALRLPSFTDSLWGDENSTNYVVNGFGAGSVLHILGHTDQEGTPPLFFMLTWLTKGIGGVEGLRLVSLLAGMAAIPLTYLLGLWTVGRTAGLVAAAIIALSPFEIFYSTEARAYALVTFFGLLAALMLLRALESGRWGWWAAYALSAAAAIYTHYNGVFVLIGLFIWTVAFYPRMRRQLVLATAGAAVLFLPWFPRFLDETGEVTARVTAILHPLTAGNVKHDVVTWSLGHPDIPTADLPGHPALFLAVAGLVLGTAGLVLTLRGRPVEDWWPPPPGVALAAILALAAPVGALIWSLLGSSIFIPRALASSWPGLAVSYGGLVTAGRPPIRFLATAMLLLAFAVGGLKMLDADNQRPDLAGVVSFIDQGEDPQAPVVDLPQPSPGPQTNLEDAFAPTGQPLPRRPVLTLGRPTLESRLNARRRGLPLFAPLPVPSPTEIAGRASSLAGRGRLYLATPGPATLEQLRRVPGPVADFLAALPPRFHEVESRTFPGLWFFDESVHVLEG